jgi:hypothetical protein
LSSAQQIYNELFAGKTVTVAFDTFTQFESLRTALCKKNQICVALDMTNASIVGTFNDKTNRGTFALTESTRKKKQNKWEIVNIQEAGEAP